ncbi:cbb3-type cytochrome oxidase assembly protein CcoS [Guyparkeria sp.]|uniref:cbb3-type cytochrome oxidase assembly protein CcoS n=1 Tax=Guyparkeria sp. TaxID=2035736 RepID=UPI003970A759
MEVLFLFVPLSMLVVAGLVWAAFWAIRNNQYEDLEGPAHRILMDDDDPKIPTNQSADEGEDPSAADHGQLNDESSEEASRPGRE